MGYFSGFEISATGMALEKSRLDAVAVNLANANTVAGPGKEVFKPLRVIAAPGVASFDNVMSANQTGKALLGGARVVSVSPMEVPPRLAYEPGHPYADERGFVTYPNVNPVSEMVTLMETVRSYEANVRAMNAAKTMALKALEIGRSR